MTEILFAHQFYCWYYQHMSILTIPKKIGGRDDLVIVPRKEYEALLVLKKMKEIALTPVQRKALVKAQIRFRQRKTLSYNDLSRKLGFAN